MSRGRPGIYGRARPRAVPVRALGEGPSASALGGGGFGDADGVAFEAHIGLYLEAKASGLTRHSSPRQPEKCFGNGSKLMNAPRRKKGDFNALKPVLSDG